MNDDLGVTAYTVIDDVMSALGYQDHVLAQVSGAEILTTTIVAARYFHNNHERALYVMIGMGYLTNKLSTSRFNRRLHKLSYWLVLLLSILGELFATGELFIIDSMPLPVCSGGLINTAYIEHLNATSHRGQRLASLVRRTRVWPMYLIRWHGA